MLAESRRASLDGFTESGFREGVDVVIQAGEGRVEAVFAGVVGCCGVDAELGESTAEF